MITVDSIPKRQLPPSITASILPFISSSTYLASVGLGKPLVFALGAAMGVPAASINARAIGFCGILMPTVPRPPETVFPILSLFGIITVMGPGKNASISICAFGGISLTSGAISSFFATCTISGLSLGRPFAL